MTAPGLRFLGRFASAASVFGVVSVSAARVASLCGTPIPAWLFVPGLVAGLLLRFSIKILNIRLSHRREASSLGARQMPVLQGEWFGNLDLVFRYVKAFRYGYPGDGTLEAVEKYGNCFNFRVMSNDLLFTCEPEHIKRILVTDFDNFVKGDEFRAIVQNVLGNGVFNSDGEVWKFHRSMTRPFFTRDKINHFSTFDRHAEDAIQQMKQRFRSGCPVDFQNLMSRFTLDSATDILLGECVHSLSVGLPYPYNHIKSAETPLLEGKARIADDYVHAFEQALLAASERARRGAIWPLFEMFKDKTEEPMRVVNAYLDPILQEAIDRQNMANMTCGDEDDEKIPDDETLLDFLVRQTSDPKVLRDEVLSIMVASRDTTTCTLTFVVYFLCTHPHVFARLREEVMSKVGLTNRPTYDHIRELKYLRAVINETLRLFPPVPFEMRQSIKATTLPSLDPSQKPFYVPANTCMTYSALLMHRRKDLWGPDAEGFDPDRFLDERLHKYFIPNPFIFLPFNAGPRICLGQQFAYCEVSFMLIRLLQNFSSMTLAPDAQPPDTLPPSEWKDATGRKAVEKIFPKMHLAMYVHGGLWVRMSEAEA